MNSTNCRKIHAEEKTFSEIKNCRWPQYPPFFASEKKTSEISQDACSKYRKYSYQGCLYLKKNDTVSVSLPAGRLETRLSKHFLGFLVSIETSTTGLMDFENSEISIILFLWLYVQIDKRKQRQEDILLDHVRNKTGETYANARSIINFSEVLLSQCCIS